MVRGCFRKFSARVRHANIAKALRKRSGFNIETQHLPLICPTGSSGVRLSNPPRLNFGISEIPLDAVVETGLLRFGPVPNEGRFAIVTDVRSGMRWTQAALLTRALPCGRRSRVVLTPRRWRQVGGSNSVDDGGKQARSPGRARSKPLKPLRGECRVSPV